MSTLLYPPGHSIRGYFQQTRQTLRVFPKPLFTAFFLTFIHFFLSIVQCICRLFNFSNDFARKLNFERNVASFVFDFYIPIYFNFPGMFLLLTSVHSFIHSNENMRWIKLRGWVLYWTKFLSYQTRALFYPQCQCRSTNVENCCFPGWIHISSKKI